MIFIFASLPLSRMSRSSSALDRTSGQPAYQEPLDQHEEQAGGRERDESGGTHLPPIDAELGDERHEAGRQRFPRLVVDQRQREEQLAPRLDEGEAEGGTEPRQGKRQEDPREHLEAAEAIDR